MELWVQSWVTSCEVYARHRGTAADFLRSLFVFPCHCNSTIRAIKSEFGSNGKIPPPSKGGPAKSMFTKSERVKLCYQQIMLLRTTKTYATYSGPGPPFGLPVPNIFTGFRPISLSLSIIASYSSVATS